jgi:hypothetical protein
MNLCIECGLKYAQEKSPLCVECHEENIFAEDMEIDLDDTVMLPPEEIELQ